MRMVDCPIKAALARLIACLPTSSTVRSGAILRGDLVDQVETALSACALQLSLPRAGQAVAKLLRQLCNEPPGPTWCWVSELVQASWWEWMCAPSVAGLVVRDVQKVFGWGTL